MTISTGTGGTIGGPSTPLQRELEATASTYIAQLRAGIVKDLLEVNIAQIGRETTWKYSATSDNPTIPILNRTRIAGPEGRDILWIDEYTNLVQMLPDDVREMLLSQSQLPFDQRSPAYAALDTVLGVTAQVIVWASLVTQPMTVERISLSHIPEYFALPALALHSVIDFASTIVSSARSQLQVLGPNYPNFDSLSRTVNDLTEYLGYLTTASLENREGLLTLIGDLSSLATQADRNPELQLLGNTARAMALVATAAALDSGSQSLLIGLQIASIGLNTSDSQAGILTPTYAAFVNQLTSGLSVFLPNSNEASQQMLGSLLALTIIGSTALGDQLANEQGIFTLELITDMLIHSGALSEFSNAVVNSAGANESTEQISSDIIKATILMTMFETIISSNRENTVLLFDIWGPYLERLFAQIERETAERRYRDHVVGPVGFELGVILQQANSALKDNNSDAFIQSLNHSTVLLGVTEEEFKNDLQTTTQTVRQTWDNVRAEDQEPITGIFQG